MESRNNLYILDRNASSTILDITNKDTLKHNDRQRFTILKNIDKIGNIISVFTSTLEVIKSGENKSEYELMRLDNELLAVNKFYKFARTDAKIVDSIKSQLSSYSFFQSFTQGMQFLCIIAPDIFNKVSPKNIKRLSYIYEKIINTAMVLSLNIHHPIVNLAIASLYGNDNVRKFLKLNKSNYNNKLAYNAMSDLTYIEFIKTVSDSPQNTSLNVLPISFDTDLIYLYNQLEEHDFHAHTRHENGFLIVDFSWIPFKKEFYPYMSEQQYKSIFTIN